MMINVMIVIEQQQGWQWNETQEVTLTMEQ